MTDDSIANGPRGLIQFICFVEVLVARGRGNKIGKRDTQWVFRLPRWLCYVVWRAYGVVRLLICGIGRAERERVHDQGRDWIAQCE